MKAAVEKRDSAAFGPAYDALTAACNSCHEATNFGFNIVQTPTANPYPNQQFRKGKKRVNPARIPLRICQAATTIRKLGLQLPGRCLSGPEGQA